MITVNDVMSYILSCKYIAAQNIYNELCDSDEPDYSNHHKIVSAWLDGGEVWHASDVYNKIPCCFIVPETVVHNLLDCQEADELQESVYPAMQPISERWIFPDELKDVDADTNSWAPARVLEISQELVHLVYVFNYTGYRKNTARVMRTSFSEREFISIFGESPTLDMFVYLGRNKSGEFVIVKNKRD